jgi:hypothetical protein
MKLNEKYTTSELKAEDLKKDKKEQTEQDKTEISKEAFALGEILEMVNLRLENLSVSMIK